MAWPSREPSRAAVLVGGLASLIDLYSSNLRGGARGDVLGARLEPPRALGEVVRWDSCALGLAASPAAGVLT
jgi:hypothetical protein